MFKRIVFLFLIFVTVSSVSFKDNSDSFSGKFKCKKFQGLSGNFNIKVTIVVNKTLQKIRDQYYYSLYINRILIGYFRYEDNQVYYVEPPWYDSDTLESMPEQVIYFLNREPKNQPIIQSYSEWISGSRLAITKLNTHTEENRYHLDFTSISSRSSDHKHISSLTFLEQQGIQKLTICLSHGGCKECIK